MQVGAPMDLFNMPANEFVAGFLGSPKMNFFAGTISKIKADKSTAAFEGGGIKGSNIRLVSTDKAEGAQARLGVRPQHLEIDPKGTIRGTVTLVERLGTETIVELLAADGTPFRFASSEAPDISVGDDLRFRFDTSKAHLF